MKMGGIKRKNRSHDNVNSSRNKMEKMEFSGSDFRACLKSNPFKGLVTFIEEAKKYPDDIDFDIVDDFCRVSADCTDILKLLSAEQFKTNEAFLVIECLQLILIRVAKDLKKYRQAMLGLIHQMLSSVFASKISRLLAMKNKSSHIKAVLRLMMASVMQGPWAAREVMTFVEVNSSSLLPLLNRKDMNDEADVKTCLIEFIISLLTCEDNSIVKRLLEVTGFLNKIMADLHGDQASVIVLFVSVLHKRVVCNPVINKTSKIRLFHEQTLVDISKLYRWTGPKHWKEMSKVKDVRKKAEEASADDLIQIELLSLTSDQNAVREGAHTLLVELCCSVKNGINFYDKTFATSGQNMNHILTNFLNAIRKPSEDPLTFELVACILKSCPDQLHFYLPFLRQSCLPRCSNNWLQSAAYVRKLYEKQPLVSPVVKFFSTVPAEELVAMTVSTVLPPTDLWLCFKEAMTMPWLPVVNESLSLVSVIIKRLAATIKWFRKLAADGASGCCDFNQFMALITEAFVKELPTLKTLTECWSSIIASISPEKSNKTQTAADGSNEISEVVPCMPVLNQMSLILQLLCGYYNLFPEVCRQHSIDFSSLLDGISKARKQSSDEPTDNDNLLYLYTLQLLSVSNIQLEDLLQETFPGRPSILTSLLEILITGESYSSDRLRSIVYHLIAKLIGSCSQFKDNVEEIEIWLKHLMCVDSKKRHACLELFVSSIQKVLKDSPAHTSPCKSKDTQQMTSFSSLVPVVLERATGQDQFIDGILVDVLYLQRDPLVFCQLVDQSSIKLPRLSPLINRHLPKKKIILQSRVVDVDGVGLPEILENYFLSSHNLSADADFSQTVMQLVESLSVEECLKASRQVVSCLGAIVEQLSKGDKGQKEEAVFHFQLLTEITRHCEKLIKQQTKLDEEIEKTPSDDILILDMMPDADGKRIFHDLSCAIFHSSVVQKYFLCMPKGNQEGKKPGLCKKAMQIVTKKLSLLAEEIVDYFPDQKLAVFETLVVRVEERMKDTRPDTWGEEVLDAVSGFINLIQLSVVQGFAETLLSDKKSELADDGGALNRYGNVLLKTFRRLVRAASGQARLSKTFIEEILNLSEIGSGAFCEPLVDLIRKVPDYSSHVQQDVLTRLLETGNQLVLSVLAALVSVSDKCQRWVVEWCAGSKKWKKTKAEYQEVMFETLKRSTKNEFSQSIFKHYWCHLLDVVCQDTVTKCTNIAVVTDFLRQLIHIAASGSVNDCWNRLISAVSNQSYLEPSQIELYVTLCEDLISKSAPDCEEMACRFISACLGTLTSLLSSKTDHAETCQLLIGIISKFLSNHKMKTSFLRKNLRSFWDDFITAGLRHHSTDHCFLELLEELISQLYTLEGEVEDMDEPVAKNGLAIVDVFEMIISQSHFMPTIMKETDNDTKAATISLLYSLVRRSSKCCKTTHITFLLGAYHAALNTTDQKLLLLLHLYENAGCKMTDFKPFFWGLKAVEHQASCKTLGMSLLPEQTMENVLDLLDKSRVFQSLLNIPLRRTLELNDTVYDIGFLMSEPDSYDPAFLLPLFSHLLEPGAMVNCFKFVEHHCLGYVIAALSCYDAGLRSLAYHTLSAFCNHLEKSRFLEKLQVSYVLECLRNSVEQPNQKLPCIITIFLAKAVHLMLTPKNHMYSLVNEFLLLKPTMDIHNVPEFYKLFFTSQVEYKVERSWILTQLLDGLRDTHDYHIMEKRFTFKIIMGFYTSPISDSHTQMLVLKIVTKSCGIRTVATDLVENHQLLSWITNISSDVMLEKRSAQVTTGVINAVVDLLHTLWSTVVDQRDGHCLWPILTAEMLMTMKRIYKYFQVLSPSIRHPYPLHKFLVEIVNTLGAVARDTYEKTLQSVAAHAQKTSQLYPNWKGEFECVLESLSH